MWPAAVCLRQSPTVYLGNAALVRSGINYPVEVGSTTGSESRTIILPRRRPAWLPFYADPGSRLRTSAFGCIAPLQCVIGSRSTVPTRPCKSQDSLFSRRKSRSARCGTPVAEFTGRSFQTKHSINVSFQVHAVLRRSHTNETFNHSMDDDTGDRGPARFASRRTGAVTIDHAA